MSRWRSLNGRELPAQAWWRLLPGILVGGVMVGLITNPVIGALVAVAAWLGTLAFSVLLTLEPPNFRPQRRPWR